MNLYQRSMPNYVSKCIRTKRLRVNWVLLLVVTYDQQEHCRCLDRLPSWKARIPANWYAHWHLWIACRYLLQALLAKLILFKGNLLRSISHHRSGWWANDGFHPIRELPRPKFDVQVGQNVNLPRPEDIRVYYTHEEGLEGLISNVIDSAYKGSTLDSVIRLKTAISSKRPEYFNEDDPNFNHKLGQEVRIDWGPMVGSGFCQMNSILLHLRPLAFSGCQLRLPSLWQNKASVAGNDATLFADSGNGLIIFCPIPNILVIAARFLTRDEDKFLTLRCHHGQLYSIDLIRFI